MMPMCHDSLAKAVRSSSTSTSAGISTVIRSSTDFIRPCHQSPCHLASSGQHRSSLCHLCSSTDQDNEEQRMSIIRIDQHTVIGQGHQHHSSSSSRHLRSGHQWSGHAIIQLAGIAWHQHASSVIVRPPSSAWLTNNNWLSTIDRQPDRINNRPQLPSLSAWHRHWIDWLNRYSISSFKFIQGQRSTDVQGNMSAWPSSSGHFIAWPTRVSQRQLAGINTPPSGHQMYLRCTAIQVRSAYHWPTVSLASTSVNTMSAGITKMYRSHHQLASSGRHRARPTSYQHVVDNVDRPIDRHQRQPGQQHQHQQRSTMYHRRQVIDWPSSSHQQAINHRSVITLASPAIGHRWHRSTGQHQLAKVNHQRSR